MRADLADHPAEVAEDFPGYVPDLNPDEAVRGWAKYGRLANLATIEMDELWGRVVDGLVGVKFRPDLLRGFIRQAGLPGVSPAAWVMVYGRSAAPVVRQTSMALTQCRKMQVAGVE